MLRMKWLVPALGLLLTLAYVFNEAGKQRELLEKRDFEAQPNQVFENLLLQEAIERDGQVLHPKVQYNLQSRMGQDMQARRERLRQVLLEGGLKRWMLRQHVDTDWNYRTDPGPDMKWVKDIRFQGLDGNPLEARIYYPDVAERKLPVLLYFHGGGFIFASINALDGPARLMANQAKAVVVSVNYRLAPEHTYPAANHDALAAWYWVRDNIADYGGDPERIAVGGDSAGAYLSVATVMALIANEEPHPVAQLLYYPVVDLEAERYRSWELFGEGFGLDKYFIRIATELYVPDEKHRADASLSPIHAPNFEQLPPAVVVSAGFDPLRDQAKAYAMKLEQAGVAVSYINAARLHHGFLESTGTIDDSGKIARESAAQLGALLAR